MSEQVSDYYPTSRLIDGDSLNVPGMGSIRLEGIDAPELGQIAILPDGRTIDAGMLARDALHEHVSELKAEGFEIMVHDAPKRDRYGRILARLVMEHDDGRAEDMNAWLVLSGLAVAEYGNQYKDHEAVARAEGAGLWGTQWQRPKDYRADKRAAGPKPKPIPSPWPRRRRRRRSTGLMAALRQLARMFR